MEKSASALNFEERVSLVETDAVVMESQLATDDSPVFKVVAYPPTAAVSIVEPGERQSRSRKGRKKFVRFIKLEAAALVVLVLALFAGTSQSFAQPSLTSAFEITIFAAALAAALIPVIFYGLPRQKYRYRGRYRRD
jgi:hypothetical protein